MANGEFVVLSLIYCISYFLLADGTPVSVRKFKAMFEQDRYYAEKAREPGT